MEAEEEEGNNEGQTKERWSKLRREEEKDRHKDEKEKFKRAEREK